MKKITVLLCDDHNVVREGMRFLLEAAADIQVVGEAQDGHQAVRQAKKLLPDVVLMDIAMPLLNGMAATRQITTALPSARILILSSYCDERFVQAAIEAGAAGYVIKESAGPEVCRAIRGVHNGQAFFSPPVSRLLLKLWQKRDLPVPTKSPARLSGRQMEVLQLIAEGFVTKQIAALLSVSTKTVEKHREALIRKLDHHNIAALTRYAISSGVVESNRIPNWPVAPSPSPRGLTEPPAMRNVNADK